MCVGDRKRNPNPNPCIETHFYIWRTRVNAAKTAASIPPACFPVNISAQNICHATLSKLKMSRSHPLHPPSLSSYHMHPKIMSESQLSERVTLAFSLSLAHSVTQ